MNKGRVLLVGALLAVSVTLTACAGESRARDPWLTRGAGLEQTLEYMERTADALPEGTALSVESDTEGVDDDQAGVMSGRVVCDGLDTKDSSTTVTYYYVGYFVTGVPDGGSRKQFMRIRQLWESWGWTLETKPSENRADYVNEDGYSLDVRISTMGTVSIEGETPCILPSNTSGDTNIPDEIGGTDS